MSRFWILGSGNWSDTAHWSATSGGVGGEIVPTSSDDVFIDSNSGLSGGTVTLDVVANCNNFTSTTGVSYTIAAGAASIINFYAAMTLESGITASTIDAYFVSTTMGKNLTFSNVQFVSINVNGLGGGWILQDNLTTPGEFYQENGTFDANDHNVTANDFYFYADTGFTPTVTMGSGTWETTDAGFFADQNNGEVVIFNPETSTIKLTGTQTSFDIYNTTLGVDVGGTFNNIWCSNTSINPTRIYGPNTFNDFKIDAGLSVTFDIFFGPTTTTVSTFTAVGTAGNLITLDVTSGPGQFTLSCPSGTISCDYLDLSNSNATGGATWYAGSHSVDTTNNDGWLWIPTITLMGANPQSITTGGTYTELGATASDPAEGDITSSIVIDTNDVDVDNAGSYLVRYSVQNSDGVSAVTVTRTVNVTDAPGFTNKGKHTAIWSNINKSNTTF